MLKSYVIRTRRFTDAQKKAYDSLAENIIIPFSEEKIDFTQVFANSENVTMEIGFGMGIATAEIAQANPLENYLGVEVHRPGIGRLLWEIENRSLSNIRIVEYNTVHVAEKMNPKNYLKAINLFYPNT
jgi:tRNA (guanine-N7-)-methyltransferase